MLNVNLKKYWWIVALVAIFLFSYYIRSLNIVPDRILSFDPTFQYRYTYYVAEYGHLPVWDELTYYVGRLFEFNTSPPLMFYITSFVYWLVESMGVSLLTLASYMSAIYGAAIVIPAFLLGRELSNKYGGLFAALLVGTAPQILTRTFGSSYDTDQIVLFFLIMTIFLGYYAFKKKTIYSYALALAGFFGFLMTWGYSFYSFFILVGFIVLYGLLNLLLGEGGIRKIDTGRLKKSLVSVKNYSIFLVLLLIGLTILATLNGENILLHITNVIGFATSAENWIVNISIAELQPFNIFSLEGWIVAMGRFITGISMIDISILLIFFFMIFFGLYSSYRERDIGKLSFLLTLFLIGIYTTFRGIRFTEFTSAFFIVIIAAGFGSLIEWTKKKDAIFMATVIGVALFMAFNFMQLSYSMGEQLGPDINANWDNAWNFLKTETPELSIVGTWWDPGHMINSLAERRNFADGAHCHNQCLYTINDRITDLGKIMATSDENVSLELIDKYKGDSPAVYWIASDDLIGKFRWLQYFGTGCDGVTDPSCPLYIQLAQSSQSADENGNLAFINYAMSQDSKIVIYNAQIPIPLLVQGINIALFDEVIAYNGTQAIPIKFSQEDIDSLITALKPLESQLGARFTNQTIPMTVWMPAHYQYIVIIPPNLRNAVFTKMFMLEGQGLDHFKQVFRNEQVKIYEVV
jgi:asparagine N-glycosylation enzyme membrane subunit Stt3